MRAHVTPLLRRRRRRRPPRLGGARSSGNPGGSPARRNDKPLPPTPRGPRPAPRRGTRYKGRSVRRRASLGPCATGWGGGGGGLFSGFLFFRF